MLAKSVWSEKEAGCLWLCTTQRSPSAPWVFETDTIKPYWELARVGKTMNQMIKQIS